MAGLQNNLLSLDNEGFETSTAGWGPNNANTTLTRDTGTVFDGTGSLKLTAVAAGQVSAGQGGVFIIGGVTYTVAFRTFTTLTTRVALFAVDWYDAAGGFVSSAPTTAQNITASTWTQIQDVITAPAGAAEMRFSIGNMTALVGGDAQFIDAVFIGVAGELAVPNGPGPAIGPNWALPLLPRIDVPTPIPATLNTFDGGTDGTTITTGNSGGASGDPWTAVAIAATGSATYVASGAYRGGMSGRFTIGGTAGLVYAERLTGNSSAGSVFVRLRFRMPVLPPDATGVRFAVLADSTGAFQADARMTNVGTIELRTGAGTLVGTSATAYTAGQWVDVGLAVTSFSATTGTLEMRLYESTGAVVQSIASAATVDTLRAGGANKIQVGAIRSGITSFSVDIDDVAMSSSGFPALASAITGATLVSQSTNTSATPSGAVAIIACTVTTAGSLLVLAIHIQSSTTTVTSVTDSSSPPGGTWVKATGLLTSGSDGEIWYRENIPAGIVSVSATMTAGTSYTGDVLEVQGITTSSALRAVNTSTTSASPNNTGAVTALAGDFIVAGVSANSSTARTQVAPFTPLTTGTLPASFTGSQGYLIPGADGSYDAQWTTASASNTGGVIAAFRNASAPVGTAAAGRSVGVAVAAATAGRVTPAQAVVCASAVTSATARKVTTASAGCAATGSITAAATAGTSGRAAVATCSGTAIASAAARHVGAATARTVAAGVTRATASHVTAVTAKAAGAAIVRTAAAHRTAAAATTAAAAAARATATKRSAASGRLVAVATASGAGTQVGNVRAGTGRCVGVAVILGRGRWSTVRPNSGPTARPNTGITARPNTGITARP